MNSLTLLAVNYRATTDRSELATTDPSELLLHVTWWELPSSDRLLKPISLDGE